MASAGILWTLLWILLSCYVALAFSSQRWCDCSMGCGGRPPTRRLPSKSTLLLANQAEHIPARERRVDPTKERWILLVEDEDDLRTAIGKFLAEEGGYYVTGVSDARSAILVCRGIVRPNPSRTRFKFDPYFNQNLRGIGNNSKNNATQLPGGPDCLVLDIRLGSMSGLELLKIIRSDPMLEGLPVVLLTAKGKVEDRILGYEVGADAYLPKPFDPEELLSIVNGLMMGKFSGESGGTTVQNNNANNELYGGLKRELMEIKHLMQELGMSESATSQSNDPEENVSLNSLHDDLLEMKEKIKGNAKQMGAHNPPPEPIGLLSESRSPVVNEQFSVLTPEEIDVVKYVAQGMTNKGIAIEMRCSVSKIEKHLSAMFNKAKVSKRADLIAWWGKPVHEMETCNKIVLKERPSTLLSAEETTVIDLLARGMTTEEIMSKTNSTKRKIATHLDNLFKKARVKSRTELIQWSRSRNNVKN